MRRLSFLLLFGTSVACLGCGRAPPVVATSSPTPDVVAGSVPVPSASPTPVAIDQGREGVVRAFDRCLIPMQPGVCRPLYGGEDLDLELEAFAAAYHPERYAAADEPVILGPPTVRPNGDVSYETAVGLRGPMGQQRVMYLELSVDPTRNLVDVIGVPAVWDGSNHPAGS